MRDADPATQRVRDHQPDEADVARPPPRRGEQRGPGVHQRRCVHVEAEHSAPRPRRQEEIERTAPAPQPTCRPRPPARSRDLAHAAPLTLPSANEITARPSSQLSWRGSCQRATSRTGREQKARATGPRGPAGACDGQQREQGEKRPTKQPSGRSNRCDGARAARQRYLHPSSASLPRSSHLRGAEHVGLARVSGTDPVRSRRPRQRAPREVGYEPARRAQRE